MKTLREYTKPVYAILIVAAALAICAVIIIFEPWSALFKRGNALSVGIVGMIIFMLLMFLKLPVAISMGTAGFFVIGVYMGWGVSFGISGSVPFASLYNYTWSTVPMFVLMGYLAKNSELAEDFYFGIRQWVGHRPGGLLHAVVIGNGAFGACSGDSIGAAVTFCSITLPETRRYGYDDSLTLGCIAGGSVLATTIPPSMMFIVYGACTQTSIGHMFIAGIIPGVLLVLAYMALVAFIAHIRPDKAPRSEKPAMKARLAATPRMLYLVVVFVVIIGGIYAGIFSPTEAGAFGSAAVLIIGVLRRKLTWKKFLLSCREAACTLGMIGLVLVGSGILQRMIVLTNLTSSLSNFLIGAISSPFVFFLVSGVILLILGCFIDALPLLLLIAPIFYPIAVKMGIDPVHYGVFMTMTIMIGTLTPPVGITVYALAGQVKELAMGKIFRGVMPFVVVLVIVCLLVALIEPMSTWLPSIMYG